MLCSESELNLSNESEGIIELSNKEKEIGKSYFKINSQTKTSKNIQLFSKGRHADIFVNENKIGEIGVIDSTILENFRIRTYVVGFVIKLSGLIFD